jgi:xylulokinase
VEAIEDPQNAGAAGAALVAAVGLGLIDSLAAAKDLVKIRKTFLPDPATRDVYDRNYRVLAGLYGANKRFFSDLNR